MTDSLANSVVEAMLYFFCAISKTGSFESLTQKRIKQNDRLGNYMDAFFILDEREWHYQALSLHGEMTTAIIKLTKAIRACERVLSTWWRIFRCRLFTGDYFLKSYFAFYAILVAC